MPAEELAEVFLEVIEGGKSVSQGAEIIDFIADNGAFVAEAVTETVTGGNGVATNVVNVVDTSVASTVTAGSGLLAVDVGIAGAAIAPALGIAAGVGLYSLAPEFWTDVSNKLVRAGQTIGGKVHALFTDDGRVAYTQETIEIFKQAFIEAGLYDDVTNMQVPVVGKMLKFAPLDKFQKLLFYAPMPSSRYTPDKAFEYFVNWYGRENLEGRYIQYIRDNVNNYFSFTIPNETLYPRIQSVTEQANKYVVSIGSTGWSDYYVNKDLTYVGRTGNAGGIEVGKYFPYPTWLNGWPGIDNCIDIVDSPYIEPGAKLPSSNPFPETYPNWEPVPTPESMPKYYPVEIPTFYPNQERAQDPVPVTDPATNPDKWVKWTIDYMPIPEPNPNPQPGPTPQPDPDPQPDPEPQPEPDPEPAEPNPPDPNEPPQPDPDPVIPPELETVDSSKLFTVYNPSIEQLDSLGDYLWSTLVLDRIIQIWQNPLDGIISLRQVYCTPVIGDSQNIILGLLNSRVKSPVVTSQFATIDCGSVFISEKNKNVTDYSPYATVHLYLPFVGIVQLDVDEVMNSTINIKYTIDVYTGTCLAEIYVTRDPDMTVPKILYTFSGNCSQTIPLNSMDATGLASTLASLGAAAIGIVAGGGALGAVGTASMIGHSLTHEMINIGHSGSLSSNAGIMGQRKPYVIIGRRHGYDANGYNDLYGFPTNKSVYLSNCSGFVRVKSIQLRSAATQAEKEEIESLLKQGVIM